MEGGVLLADAGLLADAEEGMEAELRWRGAWCALRDDTRERTA